MEKEFLSTTEAAKLLNISRVAVFKKIKSGDIKAERIGRNFVISKKDLPEILGTTLGEAKRNLIEKAVRKTIKDYGETLRLLGEE
ncbi:MAG TPA: helix-turn-helix domain-containing protein [Candidatus Colwellbacteria bacterium]|nr:helix-turn-helix domain-containing protein [Candidatus Colwellbacteria bacterium]HQA95789.1 helix-turn-helix domain-containing protein [Candidatus Colwellbacteria bacterium]